MLLGLLLLLPASSARADAFDAGPLESGALAAAADVPEDFVEETAFANMVAPASIAFSPDGRVFVAQLDGVIKVFEGLDDTTASVYADLSTNVAWHNDRGLMGMVLDPQFTTGRPYLYVAYTTTRRSARRPRAGTTTAPTRPAPSAKAAWSAAGSRRSCPTAPRSR